MFSLLLGVGGWLENWRVMLISSFNYVEVEVEAELGKNSEPKDEKQKQLLL